MKRFYKLAAVAQQGDMFAVVLDGKPARIPGGELLVLRAPRLADAIAGEWAAQDFGIDFDTMPLTRLASVALGAVARERAQIAAQILKFARSDLVCYRAAEPPELAERQARAWDAALLWARTQYRADLKTGTGLAFIEQPAQALAALEGLLRQRDDFALTGLHAATAILGSLVLALALADGKLDAAAAFAAAHIDESFQAEKWGRDAEAEERLARLKSELEAAERFLLLL